MGPTVWSVCREGLVLSFFSFLCVCVCVSCVSAKCLLCQPKLKKQPHFSAPFVVGYVIARCSVAMARPRPALSHPQISVF